MHDIKAIEQKSLIERHRDRILATHIQQSITY